MCIWSIELIILMVMCRRVSACEIFLNFSVRMPKNHIFCDRSIERTVQILFSQSQKLSLKKAKLSLKKRWVYPPIYCCTKKALLMCLTQIFIT